MADLVGQDLATQHTRASANNTLEQLSEQYLLRDTAERSSMLELTYLELCHKGRMNRRK
jgi:hypothetical protein